MSSMESWRRSAQTLASPPFDFGKLRIDGFRMYVDNAFVSVLFPRHLPSHHAYPPSLTSSLTTSFHRLSRGGGRQRKSVEVQTRTAHDHPIPSLRLPRLASIPSSHPLTADTSSNGQTQPTNQQRLCEHDSKLIPISHSKARLRRKV
jgi:hypothetical protein